MADEHNTAASPAGSGSAQSDGSTGGSVGSRQEGQHADQRRGRDWRRLRDMGVATLAWLAVVAAIFWGLAHVIGALLLFILAAILAYALSPAVKQLERFMPRGVAIALVYIGILSTLSGLIYLIVITAVGQVSMLLSDIQSLLATGPNGQQSPLVAAFKAVGLSDAQIQGAANRMLQQVQNLTGDAVSVAASILDAVVRTILVGVLSIYLLKDGPQLITWLRNNTPIAQRPHVVFCVNTLDTVVGGYIRGQLTLSALIGILVGGGMWALHVPYAVFLGVLAFVLEFVPLVGVFVSGAICLLLALTVGWVTAVVVLAYFVLVHFIEGDILGPRIMSSAVGLHPAVSILALIAGAELFGVWGALFAAPVAGLVQAVLRALWLDWRTSHPEQFPTGYTVATDVRIVPVTHAEVPLPTTVEADVTREPLEPLYPAPIVPGAPVGLDDDQSSPSLAAGDGASNGQGAAVFDGRIPDAAGDMAAPEATNELATPRAIAPGADRVDGRERDAPIHAGKRLLPDVDAWKPSPPTPSLYDLLGPLPGKAQADGAHRRSSRPRTSRRRSSQRPNTAHPARHGHAGEATGP